MLNLPLLANWKNWVIILSMLLIASFAVNSLSKIVLTGENE